jgi:hypothetical protein
MIHSMKELKQEETHFKRADSEKNRGVLYSGKKCHVVG